MTLSIYLAFDFTCFFSRAATGYAAQTEVAGELQVKEVKISSKSSFKLNPKDYNIVIPSVVADKIAEVIDVTVECTYQPK